MAVISIFALGSTAGLAANFYQGISPTSLYWTGGIVPYVFDSSVTPAEQVVYLDGMREWELAANVHFIPHTVEPNYVILSLDYTLGTNTFVASVPPVMTIDTLSRGQICHETGHLLGFQHEHVRTDRDTYITVNFDNLADGTTSTNSSGEGSVDDLYDIDATSTPFGPYDFESVMHYGRTLFSIDPATLDVLVPNAPYFAKYYYRLGNAALSPGDRAGAAYLYGPPTTALTSVVTNTADVGFGSLRAAIYYANDNPGTTITFNIPANDPGFVNGVFTIYTTGELPPITADGTVIDATTQPGYAGHPIIALNGSQLIPQIAYPSDFFVNGLHLFAANCTVNGMVFDNFPYVGISVEYAYAVSNRIEGCYFGLSPDGANPAPNTYQGIMIDTGASHNVIGGTNASQRNVISGNTQYGILIIGTNGQMGATQIGTNTGNNLVLGNYIGLSSAGNASLSNHLSGIGIWGGATSNFIGGARAGAGNVISGNFQYGVYVGDPNTVGTVFKGNFIGTDASGAFALMNGFGGIINNGAGAMTVGSVGAGNVLSGNGSAGLWLVGTANNVVQGNYMGLDATGSFAVANTVGGLYVLAGSTNNLIGGTNAGEGNIISGNVTYGILISDAGTSNLTVQGNFIGTDAHSSNSVPNNYSGIGIFNGAANLTIGGAGGGNVISGNNNGISLGGPGVSGIQIQGNFIGTAADGITALPNTYLGVYIQGGPQGNLVGGTLPGQGNVISGNVADGIQFFGTAVSNNLVEGNLIGTTRTGLTALPNGQSGISFLYGPQNNTVGGAPAAARNVISGNNSDGLYLIGATNTVIQGNYIGVGVDGATALGNGIQGIVVTSGSTGNVIGVGVDGSGAGNVIANSADEGVYVFDTNTVGNTIRGNSIFQNGALGINLAGGTEDFFGVTANHSGILPGPNDLQNYPVITSASGTTGSTSIIGVVTTTANRAFLIDIYAAAAADPSGHGQGATFLGSTGVTTDATGSGSFLLVAGANLTGQTLSATATDLTTGDTSEFSADVVVAPGTSPSSPVLSGPFTYSASAGFGFNLSLQPGQSYTVQVTTNLAIRPIVWATLSSFVASRSTIQFTDGSATNPTVPAQFYRVVSP